MLSCFGHGSLLSHFSSGSWKSFNCWTRSAARSRFSSSNLDRSGSTTPPPPDWMLCSTGLEVVSPLRRSQSPELPQRGNHLVDRVVVVQADLWPGRGPSRTVHTQLRQIALRERTLTHTARRRIRAEEVAGHRTLLPRHRLGMADLGSQSQHHPLA